MSTLNTVETLFSISLNQLCQFMNKDTLQYALKSLPPAICIKMMWKILGLNDHTIRLYPQESGQVIAQMASEPLEYCMSPNLINPEVFERSANNQQTKYVDRFNFSSLIDQQLFFELIEVTSLRSHLFTLFQICIQIKGYNFPSNFAHEWVHIESPDSIQGIYLPDIEKGLKLGVFLGDAGWLVESALVLSHTYKIITTKWVCNDQNEKLLKTLQCLTKWLLVVSNYYNFVEAKIVLQHLLHTIGIIEQIEERTLSISYAYLAVSKYYFVLLEFDKAWCWAIKAILDLHMANGVLKMLVLSHSIKICCALYKFNIARKLRKQIMACQDKLDDDVCVDLLLSHANYLFNIESSEAGIENYYVALDTARNLFGYYNLNTAIVLANYAFDRYKYENSELDNDESMRCILQAIFIMQKIGVPNDNMLLVNAHQVKSLILQEIAYSVGQRNSNIYIHIEGDVNDMERTFKIEMIKQFMFRQVEDVCIKSLLVTLQSLGENNLLTAKTYCYLGTLYIYQDKYAESEEMYLKEIETIRSILGIDHVEFAISTGHLAHLYSHHLNKFQEAELLLLQTIAIYESISDGPIREIESDLDGLIDTYKQLNNMERFDYYTDYLATIDATHDTWFDELQSEITEESCTNIDLSLEKFKCILSECSCGE